MASFSANQSTKRMEAVKTEVLRYHIFSPKYPAPSTRSDKFQNDILPRFLQFLNPEIHVSNSPARRVVLFNPCRSANSCPSKFYLSVSSAESRLPPGAEICNSTYRPQLLFRPSRTLYLILRWPIQFPT
jgi:hypothetical protein